MNIWRFSVGATTNTGKTEQPAVFPEALARDHILSWSNKGDLVLDPFNGSGTTCLQARDTGRRFIGVDVSEDYCDIARRRLSFDAEIATAVEELSSKDFEDLIV